MFFFKFILSDAVTSLGFCWVLVDFQQKQIYISFRTHTDTYSPQSAGYLDLVSSSILQSLSGAISSSYVNVFVCLEIIFESVKSYCDAYIFIY